MHVYMVPFFTLSAALIARKIREPGSSGASEFVRNLPRHLKPSELVGRGKKE